MRGLLSVSRGAAVIVMPSPCLVIETPDPKIKEYASAPIDANMPIAKAENIIVVAMDDLRRLVFLTLTTTGVTDG